MSLLRRTLFLSWAFFILAHTSILASARADSCTDQVIKALMDHPLQKYNQAIKIELSGLDSKKLIWQFDEILSQSSGFAPSFPKKEFMRWYKKNPLSDDEIKLALNQNKTTGDLIQEQIKKFQKLSTHHETAFNKAVDELDDILKRARNTCGESIECQEKLLTPFFKRNSKKMFSCLRADPDTLRSVITGFAIANAGYVISHATNKNATAKDFPYELVLTNALWTPILGEIGCKNKARSEAQSIGKTNTGKSKSLLQKAKIAGQSYWSYMKYSPHNEISYMVFHLATDKYIRGKEVDLNPVHLGKELGMYMMWDAAWAVPRSVLILDPLYTKAMPEKVKPFIQGLIKNKAVAEGAYTTLDVSMRVAVGAGNTRLFQWYEKTAAPIFNPVKKEDHTEKSNVFSSKPIQKTESFTEKRHQKIKTDSVPTSDHMSPGVPVISTRKSCETLAKEYETCMENCSDFEAISEKYQTPTCKICMKEINAYEERCGSYW